MKKYQKRLLAFFGMTTAAVCAIQSVNKMINGFAKRLSDDKNPDMKTFSWRFGDVIYTKKGSGKPLLLVHDLTLGSSSFEWHKIADVLAKKHTVYLVDLPNCGFSERQKITFTNFYYVQFLTEFVKTVIGQPTNVIATGYSASFVVTSCNYNQNLFKKLLLVNPAPLHKLNKIPSKRTKLAKSLLEHPLLGTTVYHILSDRDHIRENFEKNLFQDPKKVTDAIVSSYYNNSHRYDSTGRYLYASIIGRYINLNIQHSLQSVNNDIVIIGGEYRNGIETTIQEYQDANAAVEAVIIPNTKQLPQMEAPVDFLRQISVFLYEEQDQTEE